MKLLVLRHGHAQTEAPADHLRALSLHGRAEVEKTCDENLDLLASVDAIWVSPYLRAQQTAAIANEKLRYPLQETELLIPGACSATLIDFLNQQINENDTVLLVGHNPLFDTLVNELAGTESGTYRMATASLAVVECSPLAKGCGNVVKMYHP